MADEEVDEVVEEVKPLPKIKIVLNDGKDEIDSATLKVQVRFDEQVISNRPTHLLFVEQTQELASWHDSDFQGRRYLHDIKDGPFYLRNFKHGVHKLRVVVLSIQNEEDLKNLFNIYFSKANMRYDQPISLDTADAFDSFVWDICFRISESIKVIDTVKVEYSIPKDVFAQKPETPFHKFIWWYVNLFFSNKLLVDDCQFKRRAVIGIPKLPFALFVGLLMIVIMIFVFLFFSIYPVMAYGFVFLVGWRPRRLVDIYKETFEYDLSIPKIRRYDQKLLWLSSNDSKDGKAKFMPFPIVSLLMVLFCGSIGYMFFSGLMAGSYDSDIGEYVSAVVMVVLPSCLILVWLKSVFFPNLVIWNELKQVISGEKIVDNLLEKRNQEVERREREYSEFLRHLALHPDQRKELKVPVFATSFSDRQVKRFRLLKEAKKARACKPYEK